MASAFLSGILRESAQIKPSAEMLKCARFFLVPKIIRLCASTPTARQPMKVASISEVPVPQNGSRSTDSDLACAKLTIHRAIFDGIADGWKNGFLRGRRSLKVLLVMSVSFKPKINLSSVIMPRNVLSGFLRLTLAPGVWLRIWAAEFDFKRHGVEFCVGIVFYSVDADNEAFALFEYGTEVSLGGSFQNSLHISVCNEKFLGTDPSVS